MKTPPSLRFSRLAIAALICLWVVPARRSDAADYQVENSHTSLVFAVSHLGYSYTYGRFNKVGGEFRFDKASPSSGSFKIVIDATSIDTNDEKRDQHLSSPDFFDVRQYPKIIFETTSISGSAQDMKLTGKLTMHGVTKAVTIPLKYLGEGKGPYGMDRCGFMSTFSVKRSDFGMKGMLPAIGDQITIMFSFEGVQK